MTDAGRPQDQGRAHRRRSQPSPASRQLLATYQAAMRTELQAILDSLAAKQAGLMSDLPDAFAVALDDPKRDRLWDRAVKLARELGAEVDLTPPPDQAVRRRTPRKVDFGGE